MYNIRYYQVIFVDFTGNHILKHVGHHEKMTPRVGEYILAGKENLEAYIVKSVTHAFVNRNDTDMSHTYIVFVEKCLFPKEITKMARNFNE